MKTKVISFRVSLEEYDALALMASNTKMELSRMIYVMLTEHISVCVEHLHYERKRLERKAKRDAKKAANGAQ
jgi:hypothetical protein